MHENEMKLDVARIRQEREKRAWTQEQLAEISSLGLRTVQRIEATGMASFESTTALSAALTIPVSELRLQRARPTKALGWLKTNRVLHICSLFATLFVALMLSPPKPFLFLALWLSLWTAFVMGTAVASKRLER